MVSQSLKSSEKIGEESVAAETYHHLGIIAVEHTDFAGGEQWYRKSLEAKERLGDEHGAAATYGQLAILATLEGDFCESAKRFVRCMTGFLQTGDAHNASKTAQNFVISFTKAPAEDQVKFRTLWTEAGLGEFPTNKED